MDDLHAELSTNPPLPGSYTARKGDLCAALFVDNNWYVSNSPPTPHPSISLGVGQYVVKLREQSTLISRHLVAKSHLDDRYHFFVSVSIVFNMLKSTT